MSNWIDPQGVIHAEGVSKQLQKHWSHTRCAASLPRKEWQQTNEPVTCVWCKFMMEPPTRETLVGKGHE